MKLMKQICFVEQVGNVLFIDDLSEAQVRDLLKTAHIAKKAMMADPNFDYRDPDNARVYAYLRDRIEEAKRLSRAPLVNKTSLNDDDVFDPNDPDPLTRGDLKNRTAMAIGATSGMKSRAIDGIGRHNYDKFRSFFIK